VQSLMNESVKKLKKNVVVGRNYEGGERSRLQSIIHIVH